ELPPGEVGLPMHQNSHTLILPVYRDEFLNSDPLHQPPPQIGEIAMTLNVTGLFRELIGISPLFALDDIGIEIFAGTGENLPASLLKYGPVAASSSPELPFLSRLLYDQPQSISQTLWLGGQPWHIVTSRRPILFIHGHSASLFILLGGLLLTAFAAFCVHRSAGYTRQIESLITQRTTALERSNRRLRKHIDRRKTLKKD